MCFLCYTRFVDGVWVEVRGDVRTYGANYCPIHIYNYVRCAHYENRLLVYSKTQVSKGSPTILLLNYIESNGDLISHKNELTYKHITAGLILRKKVDCARHRHDKNR